MRSVLLAVLAICLSLPTVTAGGDGPATTTPLLRAHAHNDYEHQRPLLDALDNGFCNVEADVYLTTQGLLVAHDLKDAKPERTLESLYLKPLRERVKSNGGFVVAKDAPFTLLIDIKSEAESTYAAIDKVLADYGEMISVTRDGRFEQKPVTVVISGNRPIQTMRRQTVRYAGIDGRSGDLMNSQPTPPDLMPWISDRWGASPGVAFKWNGEGPMSETEREQLRQYVKLAHGQKRKVRFWATPENPEFWKELHAADVDLIGTDHLVELKEFLRRAEVESNRKSP